MTVLLLLFIAGALAYSALSVFAALRYLMTQPPAAGAAQEPISILKPLSGLDEGLEENLRSFFAQDYPVFELIFAVRQETDPCVPLVRRLCAEYTAVPSQLLIVGAPDYPHAKVFSLSRLIAASHHDLLVMSDSDIRVTPNMLARVAAEFADGSTALATCPYRAVAGPGSIWSRMEAEGMNTTFWQGVLTARLLEGMKFAVGPTIVARKKAIAAIGGIQSVKDYIAEDFDLGRLIAASGARVILSSYVIEHHIGSETLAANTDHRIRWGRTSRRSRPAGYFGQIFTYPLPLALLLWLLHPHWWPFLAMVAVIRGVAGWVTSQMVLGARVNWLLLPLEDLMGFVFWMAGFHGKTITWRGQTYLIDAQGRAVSVTPRLTR